MFSIRFVAGAVLGDPQALASHGTRIAAGAAAWCCLTFAVYLFNGACDVPEDRQNGSTRPIARGALPQRQAVAAAAACAAAGLVLASMVPGTLPLAVGLLVLGLAYSAGPYPLKRWPLTCAVVVSAAGILSYAAGDIAAGAAVNPRLVAFAAAMSAWMIVGGLAKDLSDVAGDRSAGRRSLPVVLGEGPARLATAITALAVAGTFLLAARAFCPTLITAAGGALAGAGALSAVALTRLSRGPRRCHRRRPYRIFAITQYAIHLTALQFAL
jgi:4-hydroxybenzoate polyprenyltransferase/chlorophyll synthase